MVYLVGLFRLVFIVYFIESQIHYNIASSHLYVINVNVLQQEAIEKKYCYSIGTEH